MFGCGEYNVAGERLLREIHLWVLGPVVLDIASGPRNALMLELEGYVSCEVEDHEAASAVYLLLNGGDALRSKRPGGPLHAVRDKDNRVRGVKIGDIGRPAVVDYLGFDVLETGTVEQDLQKAG